MKTPAATPVLVDAPSMPTNQLLSPPFSQSVSLSDPKHSLDVPGILTPPLSPSSQVPALQKEQEEFEGTVNVNNRLSTAKDLSQVEDILVLDAQGWSRPFRKLYQAPHIAPRQLIIFIRHFFCGNCQEYLRTISSSIKPEDLLALPTPTSITVIGCGQPELIPMYMEATSCPFPIYAEPTRKLYDQLGMTRTFELGDKPAYMHTNMLINSVQSIFQGLGSGKNAWKGGDMKQVGGEFLFENGECTFVHRMKTTRDHTEVSEIRALLGLDGTLPPPRKRWSHGIKEEGQVKRRSRSWGLVKGFSKRAKNRNGSEKTTPERVVEQGRTKLAEESTA